MQRHRRTKTTLHLFNEFILLTRSLRPMSALASNMGRKAAHPAEGVGGETGRLKAMALLPLRRTVIAPSSADTRRVEVRMPGNWQEH